MKNLILTTILLLVGVVAAVAAPGAGDKTKAALDNPLHDFNAVGGPLKEVIPLLSRATGIPVVLDKDVAGQIDFECTGMTVRQFLTAACSANGMHYIVHPDGYVLIRSRVTRIYPIDFIAAEKSVSASTSSSVSSGGSGSSSTGGASAGGASMASSGSSGASGASGSAGGGTGTSAGSNSIVTSTNNEGVFWKEIEDQAKKMLQEGDTFLLNRTGGFAQLDAPLKTQAQFEAYWRSLMDAVNRGVRVKVTVLDVQTNDSSRLGVDWEAAAGRLGSLGGRDIIAGRAMMDPTSGTTINRVLGSTGGITSVGSVSLPEPTFMGTIGIGKLAALISALKQQGAVTKKSAPTVALLNNRSAVIQVSLDRNFFSKSQDYDIITSGSTSGDAIANGTRYSATTYSFGILFYVTAQVSSNGVITLDVEPTLTDFVGVEKSADGAQELPARNLQKVNTQVRMTSGQSYVLGGYIRNIEGSDNRAIPGVSKVPVLGKAFQNDTKVMQTSEMVFIVTAELMSTQGVRPIEVITPDPAMAASAEVVAFNGAAAGLYPAAPASVLPADGLVPTAGIPAEQMPRPTVKPAKESRLIAIPE